MPALAESASILLTAARCLTPDIAGGPPSVFSRLLHTILRKRMIPIFEEEDDSNMNDLVEFCKEDKFRELEDAEEWTAREKKEKKLQLTVL